jgi:hypothetical protein
MPDDRLQEVRESLEERLREAEEDVRNSSRIAPNSHGAGYDRGYLDALRETLAMITGEPE